MISIVTNGDVLLKTDDLLPYVKLKKQAVETALFSNRESAQLGGSGWPAVRSDLVVT